MTPPSNMPSHIYSFAGRVHPERAAIWMDERKFGVKLSFCEWQGGEVTLSINSGQISIIFAGDSKIEDVATLKNAAQSLVQNFVDAIGYSLGRACTVELTSLTTGGSQTIFFDDADATLPSTIHQPAIPMRDLLTITGESLWLRRALGELRQSLAQPDDTAFHCYRAIESVRRHFQPEKNEVKGWQNLREALNVSKETLKTLKEFGDPQRHGDITLMSYEDRARDMKLAWMVIDRFVILIYSKVATLDVVEFPLI